MENVDAAGHPAIYAAQYIGREKDENPCHQGLLNQRLMLLGNRVEGRAGWLQPSFLSKKWDCKEPPHLGVGLVLGSGRNDDPRRLGFVPLKTPVVLMGRNTIHPMRA